MKNRLACFAAFAALAVSPLALADDHYNTFDQEMQAALTPDEALQLLKDGNARFVAGESIERDLIEQQKETASGQYPFAVVLSCLDSRSAPEVVFDQGVGDLFVGRVAGNVVDTNLLGSFEFATAAAGSKLIVVMGHTECGAVKGACDGVELGNLTRTLANIRPAVEAVSGIPGERNSKNRAFVDAVAHENVRQTVQNIVDRSEVLRELVEAGKLKVVGAMYDVATGEVTFLDS